MKFTFTRAELEESRFSWRWITWCREWGYIGAAFAELDRLERALWERS